MIRRILQRLPLRISRWTLLWQLLVILIVLLTGGLFMHMYGAYSALEKHLTKQIDEQLDVLGDASESYLVHLSEPGETPSFLNDEDEGLDDSGAIDSTVAQSGLLAHYVQIRDIHNTITEKLHTVRVYGTPRIPDELPLEIEDTTFITVEGDRARGGDDDNMRWRVRIARIPENRGYLVLAQALKEMDDTLSTTREKSLLWGAFTLVLASVAGWWLVRRSLRPLTQMSQQARSITTKELSVRVTPDMPHTEVGALGGALNTMLGRLEESFAAQRASEERLRRFIADASHELRTPLTSIRGYAEMFRRGVERNPEDTRVAMRRIESEATRMSELVDELLILARLDEGRPLKRDPVHLTQIVDDVAADLRAAVPRRDVRVETDVGVWIMGDSSRLHQVVANLATNARQYTADDAVITLSVRDRGDVVRLECADTGPGLSTEDAERVFERFYRAEASRAREGGGYGLGLAVVAAVVYAHRGQVGVETQLGEGARFWIELPKG